MSSNNKEFNEDDTVWYWDSLGQSDPATVLSVEGGGRYFIRIDRNMWGGTSCITVPAHCLSKRNPSSTASSTPRPEAWIEQVFQNMEG